VCVLKNVYDLQGARAAHRKKVQEDESDLMLLRGLGFMD
jgi:hypothetical protein